MRWETTLKDTPRPEKRSANPVVYTLYSPPRVHVPPTATPIRGRSLWIGRALSHHDPAHEDPQADPAETLPVSGIGLPGDPRVSRNHARLDVAPNGDVRLTDASSTGTHVNGTKVETAVLKDGDLIRAGNSFLLFREHVSDTGETEFGFIGQAPAIVALRRTLQLVGESDATVLILGESGTGKELAARAVHEASGRKGRFVAVNCGAIPETLAESQLFGHVAGAYTGAKSDAAGFFRAADHGTLFLDEVGDLAITLQPKLLRALEERAVTPVGATKSIPCDVRVVAATNRDLIADISAQQYRGDLYARLAEFTLELPPLRQRREDILPILMASLGSFELDPKLVSELLHYEWPFNVRELLKVAKQLAIQARAIGSNAGEPAPRLTLDMVATSWQRLPAAASQAAAGSPSSASAPAGDSERPASEPPSAIPNREELEAMLRKHAGVIAHVARETGRSRKQVYRWLEQHGLRAEVFRTEGDPSEPKRSSEAQSPSEAQAPSEAQSPDQGEDA